MPQDLAAPLGIAIHENVPLAPLTTLGIGGPARALVELNRASDLVPILDWVTRAGLPVLFLGEGSNLLVSDDGFDGLVIHNRLDGIERDGSFVNVGAGTNLMHLIRWLNQRGLAGLESMYGIPGSVAGAIVGNAGAYGQEIREVLVEVEVISQQGTETLLSSELDLQYRHSLFKERRDLFVSSCLLRLSPEAGNLQAVSDSILEKRLVKYPAGLRCPGSFFKNVVADQLTDVQRANIPSDFFYLGKVPAGKLLEAVGANGQVCGRAMIAEYHGNLMMNLGGATSRDILNLARQYAEEVENRFGIVLEPEVRIVGGSFREPAE